MKIADVINEAPININVRGIQQAARVKAYNDAIAAGKSEAEAQNAEAAAGNLAGANALSKINLNNPSTYINVPGATGPRSEAERQRWIQDPTKTATAIPVADPTPISTKSLKSSPSILGIGSNGPAVKALQTRLGITPDSKYGPVTRDAVIALQKQLGVEPDGVYGPQTKAAHDKQSSASVTEESATQSNESLDQILKIAGLR